MFFKKEMPEIKESWSVHQSEYNNLPVLVRKNDGAKIISGKGILNFRSGLSFALLVETENGLQSETETDSINKIEDQIFLLFNDAINCIVTTIISTNSFKEYIIYHNEKMDFGNIATNLQNAFSDYRITTYTSKDKKWDVYDQF